MSWTNRVDSESRRVELSRTCRMTEKRATVEDNGPTYPSLSNFGAGLLTRGKK